MTRIRFRTDSDWIAEAKALGKTFEQHFPGHPEGEDCGSVSCPFAPTPENRARWDATPVAEPGDTWRFRWARTIDVPETVEMPIAGYGICCPKCREVHRWTTALNCASRRALPGGGATCAHSGTGSCWQWSGSAEAGTLSATPSLHAVGACGWHGWLTNGVLHGG